MTYLGAETEYLADLDGTTLLVIHPTPAHGDPRRRLAVDDRVTLQWDPLAARLIADEKG